MTLYEYIKIECKKKGVTIGKMCTDLHIPPTSFYSNIKDFYPNTDRCIRIAEYLGIEDYKLLKQLPLK